MRTLRELAFLEVRVDPEIAERNDRHQRLAGLRAIADLHRALRDVTAERRDDRRALVVDPRLAERGLRLHDGRVLGDLRAVDERVRSGALAQHLVERVLGVAHGFLRVRDFLGRDRLVGEQRLATVQVGLRLREVGPAARDRRVVLRGLLGLLAHLAHGTGERAPRLGERDFGVGRIEPSRAAGRSSTSCVSSASTAVTVPAICEDTLTWLPLT